MISDSLIHQLRGRGFLAERFETGAQAKEAALALIGTRSGGIGGQMLDAMLARCSKRACLEAELPETELAARRIGFYERHGFTVNADYPYFQPALTPGGSIDRPGQQDTRPLVCISRGIAHGTP